MTAAPIPLSQEAYHIMQQAGFAEACQQFVATQLRQQQQQIQLLQAQLLHHTQAQQAQTAAPAPIININNEYRPTTRIKTPRLSQKVWEEYKKKRDGLSRGARKRLKIRMGISKQRPKHNE